MKTSAWAAGLLLLAGVIAGCNNDGIASLEGTLLIDDKPAPEGVQLAFDSLEPGVRGAAGVTDSKGRFYAIYSVHKNGAPVGECRARLANGQDMTPPEPGKPLNRKYPDEYYTEITTFTVESGGSDIELEITSKKD